MTLPHLIWLYRFLWIAPHLLLLAVAAVMFRKGLHKSFPIFFVYLLFEFLMFAILYPMALFRWATTLTIYVRVDMLDRAGNVALFFGVIQEMFEAPLAHNTALRRGMAQMRNRLTAILVVLASAFIVALCYGTFEHSLIRTYVIVEVLNTVQCGLLLFVFLWHWALGLRMSPFTFGIAVGMMLTRCIEPLEMILNAFVPQQNGMIGAMLNMATYHAAVLIWLYYASAREEVPSISYAALPQFMEQASEIGRIAHL